MGRWARARATPVIVGLVLVGGAVVWTGWTFRLPPSARSDALAVLGIVLGLIGVLPLVVELGRRRRPPDPLLIDKLADLLAQAVRGQWRKAATERVLVTPAPIPVRWSLSDLPVAGPVEAAVGDPDEPPAFSPLLGQARATEAQLRAGGGRSELFAVYAGVASGRIIVVGAPGSGKSSAAILLLLDALDHRERVDAKDRPRVPVPVLFTVHGWDPTTRSVQDWLTDQLVATYPIFQYRGGRDEAVTLVATGAVALFLDGLDEMDLAWRPVALQALNDAPFRVVLLTRSQEMVQAASGTWLAGAVAVHLDNVTGPDGADYLRRARSGPEPMGWTQLFTHLREDPDSALARGLSTPLALTLLRDTYRPGDDVSDLLDNTKQHTVVDLEQHLIARVLPDAYNPRPGRPIPRYSLIQAKQILTFVAKQMNEHHTRDLAWWQIPRWAPTTPRILASMLAGGLLGGLLGGVLGWLGKTLVTELAFGAELAIGSGYEDIVREQLAFGLGVGLPIGLGAGRGDREPQQTGNWRAISMHTLLTVRQAYGLLLLLALVLLLVLPLAPLEDVSPGLMPPNVAQIIMAVVMFILGFTVGLPLAPKRVLDDPNESDSSPETVTKSWRNDPLHRLALGFPLSLTLDRLGELHESEGTPQGPLESWRNDRMCGLACGLMVGLGSGLWFWLVAALKGLGPVVAVVVGLMFGLILGLPVGLVYGVMSSATWSTTLAWLQLQASRHVLAVRLMPFLEDARDRGVLRTVGPIYQFRHAKLQDQLAN